MATTTTVDPKEVTVTLGCRRGAGNGGGFSTGGVDGGGFEEGGTERGGEQGSGALGGRAGNGRAGGRDGDLSYARILAAATSTSFHEASLDSQSDPRVTTHPRPMGIAATIEHVAADVYTLYEMLGNEPIDTPDTAPAASRVAAVELNTSRAGSLVHPPLRLLVETAPVHVCNERRKTVLTNG